MYTKIFLFTILIILLTTQVSLAAPANFKELVGEFTGIINKLVLLIFTLTFFAVIWGVVKGWVLQGESEEGVENGKKVAVAGVVAFVVMGSLWGILYILKNTLFGG